MPNILVLNNEYPPLGGGTGVANQALILELSKDAGLNIDLITSLPAGGTKNLNQPPSNIKIHYVNARCKSNHHSTVINLALYAILASVKAFQLARKNQYQVCLAFSALPAGFIALIIKLIFSVPYYVRISGPELPGFEIRFQKIYPILFVFFFFFWKFATRIIAKSNYESERLKQIRNCSGRVTTINNGVDCDFFTPQSNLAQNPTLRLVYVARLIERKGQQELIKVISELTKSGANIHLDLVGTGDEEANLQSLIKMEGLVDQIKLHGEVAHKELLEIYQANDIFVSASQAEGMSVAALEALACGLALIAPKERGFDELLHTGTNGFEYNWGDWQTLRAAIEQLQQNRELLSSMKQASRKLALKYSWQAAAERYRKLLSI